MSSASVRLPDTHQAKSLTDMLQTKLRIHATSPEFDFHNAVDQALADVGLTARDSGGKLTFYGLGTYQGMTDQAIMSGTRGALRTVLAPCGSSKPVRLA